jgi:hypothetical protein
MIPPRFLQALLLNIFSINLIKIYQQLILRDRQQQLGRILFECGLPFLNPYYVVLILDIAAVTINSR